MHDVLLLTVQTVADVSQLRPLETFTIGNRISRKVHRKVQSTAVSDTFCQRAPLGLRIGVH